MFTRMRELAFIMKQMRLHRAFARKIRKFLLDFFRSVGYIARVRKSERFLCALTNLVMNFFAGIIAPTDAIFEPQRILLLDIATAGSDALV